MHDRDWLAARFEEHRPRLRAVATRLLGESAEADDAVQEAWLRLSRTDSGAIVNLGGWLTTVVGRVCLDLLRARAARREAPLGDYGREPRGARADGGNPEDEALLADAVGLALLVVLDRLPPAERLAFVLHDLFGVPFDEIAPIVGRAPAAARQLASRARRRVRGAGTVSDADLARQRVVVDAFLAAVRAGDMHGLLAVLDPDVVLHADGAAAPAGAAQEVRGALIVAERALIYQGRARFGEAALVDGAVGILVAPRGRLVGLLGFTITGGKIARIDVIADPAHLRRLNLAALGD